MPKRVLITGPMAQSPLGGAGAAWAFLQYVLGFRRLGFETYYAEELKADACIDDEWQRADFTVCANVRFIAAIAERFGLQDRVALLEQEGERHFGLSRAALESLAPDIDLLVNLSGRFHVGSVLAAVRRRLYLDMDPGFTQIWQDKYGIDMNLRSHDVHVTVGLNLGQPDCPLPTCGLRWQTTLPPVVLDQWRTTESPGDVYTTVADWRGYSPVEWDGVWYGQKSQEFMRIVELPTRVPVPLEICLAIHPDEPDLPALERHRWRLVSPRVHAATVDGYRDYVRRSRGECTPVKHGYAAGRSGWFSDRSACYLAAGRPVVMQETGVSRYVPTGDGFMTFIDLDSAVAALAAVEDRYAEHANAARRFAREHLDSDKVLTRLRELSQ
jgi:hypothetical protein